MLPMRGYRYCEAVAAASAFGWYIYPPLSFSLMWDGVEIAWTYAGAEDWYPLRGAQFPGFRQLFEEVAPTRSSLWLRHFLPSRASPASCKSGAAIWRARRRVGHCSPGVRPTFRGPRATSILKALSSRKRGS